MFDLRKMLMMGGMTPVLPDMRSEVISLASLMPMHAIHPSYSRSSRPAGTRARKRWKIRRAAGRA